METKSLASSKGPAGHPRANYSNFETARPLTDEEAEAANSSWESKKRSRFFLALGFVIVFVAIAVALFVFYKDNNGTCHTDPGCASAGIKLGGDCCPTASGKYLQCCSLYSHFANNSVNEGPGACNSHAACKAEGLTGQCCPTASGINLGCCG